PRSFQWSPPVLLLLGFLHAFHSFLHSIYWATVNRKGPPELDGKLLATFELQGRDMIMIDSKSRNISSAFTYAKANFGVSQNFYQKYVQIFLASALSHDSFLYSKFRK
ncbi:hypothetical protein DL96DRAFT_1585631, partial [Flagelloscypha sp. PMI_526]